MLQVFTFAALVVATIAIPGSHPRTSIYAPAKYDFNYAVND